MPFETWKVFRVCLHTDVRDQRSSAAMEGVPGNFALLLSSVSDPRFRDIF